MKHIILDTTQRKQNKNNQSQEGVNLMYIDSSVLVQLSDTFMPNFWPLFRAISALGKVRPQDRMDKLCPSPKH
jgi:hypothetical protein